MEKKYIALGSSALLVLAGALIAFKSGKQKQITSEQIEKVDMPTEAEYPRFFIESKLEKPRNRILVLTAYTEGSGGHKSASDALKSFFEKRRIAVDILSIHDKITDKPEADSISFETNPVGCAHYFKPENLEKYIKKYAKDHKEAEAKFKRNAEKVDEFANKIASYFLKHNKYDAVISVSYNRLKFKTSIPQIIIPMDPGVDYYYKSGDDFTYLIAAKGYKPEGINPKNIHYISSVPVRPVFFEDTQPRALRQKQLGLQPGTVLVMFGSFGSEYMFDIMEQLYKANIPAVFLAGKYKDVYNKLSEANIKLYKGKFTILPQIDNVHKYMQACRVVIGKPGGSTAIELETSKDILICAPAMLLENEKPTFAQLFAKNRAIAVKNYSEGLVEAIHKAKTDAKYLKAYDGYNPGQGMKEIYKFISEAIKD